MSFRCRQYIRLAHCIPVTVHEQVTLESGEVVNESKDLGKEKLPDAELFDLKNQLKAGIDLEEVNSKVLKPSKVDGSKVVRKLNLKVNKPKEMNNEGE